jgi:hypothetical protein
VFRPCRYSYRAVRFRKTILLTRWVRERTLSVAKSAAFRERRAERDRQFRADCWHWYKEYLTGRFGHWCPDWDDLPIDETCSEFSSCGCYPEDPDAQRIKDALNVKQDAGLEASFLSPQAFEW